MKKYSLRIYPDSVLRDTASHVNNIDETSYQLIKSMSDIMYDNRAIGLAAPQIGVLKRIVVVDIGEELITMINPEILSGFGKEPLEEGCLSLPNTKVNVDRKVNLFVRYTDKNEKEFEREFKDLTARVIQHEIDHLNGVLIIDHAPVIDKSIFSFDNKFKNKK
ncbi:MAG: peptide deformylase [Melioribacteraceae bacterium]|nr:peptide deformylase [Melioribacteraceae bacterium]